MVAFVLGEVEVGFGIDRVEFRGDELVGVEFQLDEVEFGLAKVGVEALEIQ